MLKKLLLLMLFITVSSAFVNAERWCCSWHWWVCDTMCCDWTQLSDACDDYTIYCTEEWITNLVTQESKRLATKGLLINEQSWPSASLVLTEYRVNLELLCSSLTVNNAFSNINLTESNESISQNTDTTTVLNKIITYLELLQVELENNNFDNVIEYLDLLWWLYIEIWRTDLFDKIQELKQSIVVGSQNRDKLNMYDRLSQLNELYKITSSNWDYDSALEYLNEIYRACVSIENIICQQETIDHINKIEEYIQQKKIEDKKFIQEIITEDKSNDNTDCWSNSFMVAWLCECKKWYIWEDPYSESGFDCVLKEHSDSQFVYLNQLQSRFIVSVFRKIEKFTSKKSVEDEVIIYDLLLEKLRKKNFSWIQQIYSEILQQRVGWKILIDNI